MVICDAPLLDVCCFLDSEWGKTTPFAYRDKFTLDWLIAYA